MPDGMEIFAPEALKSVGRRIRHVHELVPYDSFLFQPCSVNSRIDSNGSFPRRILLLHENVGIIQAVNIKNVQTLPLSMDNLKRAFRAVLSWVHRYRSKKL